MFTSYLFIIFLVSFPTLLNVTKNDSKKEKEDLSETICEAGKTYIYNNIEDYNDQIVSGNEITISIQTLIDNELVKEGKYIIMSAHEMHTIEEFCTDVVILNRGKTVLKGNLKERESFADIGATIADYMKIAPTFTGKKVNLF